MLSLGLSACGHKVAHPTHADNEGVYVDAGPLTYQVQLSRELNPFNVEDKGYLAGVSAPPPAPDQLWFAVFLWAKNETGTTQTTATQLRHRRHAGHPVLPGSDRQPGRTRTPGRR